MAGSLEELLHSKDAINITGKIYICDDECLFEFDNVLEYGTKIMNENDLLTIVPSGESSISFLNEDYCPEYDQYMLKEIFINGPSRHTLYGKRHDLGIEMVYSAEDQKQLVVITVFGDQSDSPQDKFNSSYQFLETVATNYFPQHLKSVTLPDEGRASFNPGKLIPPQKQRTFFTYQRSRKVKQIVMENPIPIPPSFMQKFKKFVVPASQYKTAMAQHPTPPGTKIIIYATIPPTVAEAPVTKAPVTKVPVTKAPVTKVPVTKAPVTEHFEDGTSAVEPADEQWGYWGVVAGITWLVIFGVILGAGMYFDSHRTGELIQLFIGLGPAKILAIVMLSVGSTFGVAWLIESKIPSTTAGKRAGKFFLYLLWYLVLTSIMAGVAVALGRTPAEAPKSGWFTRLIDKCEPKAEPPIESTIGLATEQVTQPKPKEVVTWTPGERPSLIGVPL